MPRGTTFSRELNRLEMRSIVKHPFHPIEHRFHAEIRGAGLACGGPETLAKPGIAERSFQPAV
jgi:hypothetical protein